MRKLILTICAAAAMLGCHKESLPTPAPQDPRAISFDNVSTRAGLSDLQKDGFGVWASVSSKDANKTVQYEPLLENERVYLKDGSWIYDNEEYWISNSMFYFFAAYPQDVFTQERLDVEGNKFTAYQAEVTADGTDATKDILVATNVTDTTEEGYSTTVKLSFGHLLSKINIKIRQNFDIDPDFNYYVTKVTITGIKGNGTFAIIPYANDIMSGWNFDNSQTLTFEKDFSKNPVLLRNPDPDAEDKVVVIPIWDDGLMLIPQTISKTGIKVRVDYLYDVNLDDESKGDPKFVEGYIPEGAWESGKSVNYTLAIANSSFISFEQPTIDPWGAPQTGGTIIIQ